MAMRILPSTWDGRCYKCDKSHKTGEWIYYDALAPKGQRAYCLPCGEIAAKTPKPVPAGDEAAELAKLKAQLAKMEAAEQPKPAPRPVEVPKPATSDPLALAIAGAIEPLLAAKLDEERVRQIAEEIAARAVKDAVAALPKPVATIEVKRPDLTTVDLGRQHKQFEVLLTMCAAKTRHGRLNIWVTGAAGTGKTTAAEMVAKALGLKFAATGSLSESYKLFGYMAPGTGNYVRTLFREIWEHGGVFIFDDFDGSDPVCVLELNNALANGSCSFPDTTIKRHEDCVLILTANTFGGGATNEYVGRMKQDAAFLDRFAYLDWQIDEQLEMDTVGNPSWVKRVQECRARAKAKGIKVLITPRASYNGAALLAQGLPQMVVEAATIRKGMTADQWGAIANA